MIELILKSSFDWIFLIGVVTGFLIKILWDSIIWRNT